MIERGSTHRRLLERLRERLGNEFSHETEIRITDPLRDSMTMAATGLIAGENIRQSDPVRYNPGGLSAAVEVPEDVPIPINNIEINISAEVAEQFMRAAHMNHLSYVGNSISERPTKRKRVSKVYYYLQGCYATIENLEQEMGEDYGEIPCGVVLYHEANGVGIRINSNNYEHVRWIENIESIKKVGISMIMGINHETNKIAVGEIKSEIKVVLGD